MRPISKSRLMKTGAVLCTALLLGSCGTLGIFDSASKDDSDKKIAPKNRRIQVMKLEEKLKPDPAIADARVSVPVSVMYPSWEQPGGVSTHALYNIQVSGGVDPKTPLRKVWSTSAGRGSSANVPLNAPPIIADGRIYVLDAGIRVRALQEQGGREIWDRSLIPDGEKARVGFGGGIAYGNGLIYAATGYGQVSGLKADTGEVLWQKSVGVPIRSAPTYRDGRLFVVATDNQLHAYDAASGRSLWQHRGMAETSGILSAVSPAVDDELVIAPFSSGEIYALRTQNGREVWSDSLVRTGKTTAMAGINDIAARPVIDDGTVYAISHSGRMVAIDMRTGERVWAKNIAGVQTPWVAGDYVYVISINAELICLSRKDGRVRWLTQLKRWEDQDDREGAIAWTGPMMVDGRLLMMNSLGEMAFFAAEDGKVLKAFRGPGKAYIPPVAAGGHVYVLNDDGDLTAMK